MTVNDSVLVCLPPAGSGASFFRGWQSDLQVVAPRLPGRESRLADPLPPCLPWLADDLMPQLDEATAGYRNVVVLGHSFGAMVAYEICHALSRSGRSALLVASGAAAPGTVAYQPMAHLPDGELAVRIAQLTGYSHPAMADPELLELIIPALRGDLRLHEEYVPTCGDLPGVPVLGVRGRDDSLITPGAVREWGRVTSGPFRYAEVTGGHMYLAGDHAELMAQIERFAGDAAILSRS